MVRVPACDPAPVPLRGPRIETRPRFPRHVNAGFMQVLEPDAVRLRVHERGAGETLACGTGACAAVVAGIRLGWLARRVTVQARGGQLLVEGPRDGARVPRTGPAETAFDGEISL